uniref:Uncharacterized protein n=1 Tax=Cucumis sativus TaxID=3659 RepID=A0A0A0K5K1_CUCSA
MDRAPSLCKRNKIPANITNVAMADALAVEGMEEFLSLDRSGVPASTMEAEVIYRKFH